MALIPHPVILEQGLSEAEGWLQELAPIIGPEQHGCKAVGSPFELLPFVQHAIVQGGRSS